MLCGTDNILKIFPTLGLNVENIPINIVSPIEYCYGSE